MAFNIIGVGIIFVITLLGLLFYFNNMDSGMTRQYLTIFFTFFVMLQFWNLFNARVFGSSNSAFKGIARSYGMILVIVIILLGQFLIVQFGGEVFRTEPLSPGTWLIIVVVSSLVLWLGEVVRFVQRAILKK